MYRVTPALAGDREQLDFLTHLHAADLLRAFRLDRAGLLVPLLEALAHIPSRRLARQVVAFDRLAGSEGLIVAGAWLLERFTRSLQIFGQEHVPPHGPLLIVSNHPGMVDAMALWVGLQRDDLRVIAAQRELLDGLPQTCRHLIFVSEESPGRSGVIRLAAAQLRRGGALLTFPAGSIEPDPAVRRDARTSLTRWATSTALFARLAPQTIVLPAVVSGVISASAQRNPVIRMLPTQKERDWAAATLQVLLPSYRDTDTKVVFGAGIPATQLLELGSPDAINLRVTECVGALLDQL
ncbi:MAG TPA: 1-acyl-sn-glycerol-3-phosphate acyltransferase [Roseiflexaceae bacterium]|nr:1-acyl-sn-glycerol-3-phosphate acyltransferase [Roseiflexaceae bacterium]